MNNSPLTNEQKLDAIYQILQDNESRRRREFWWSILKRIVIFWGIILIYANYKIIIEVVIEKMKPMIMEQAKSIMEENQSDIMEQAKKMMNK